MDVRCPLARMTVVVVVTSDSDACVACWFCPEKKEGPPLEVEQVRLLLLLVVVVVVRIVL